MSLQQWSWVEDDRSKGQVQLIVGRRVRREVVLQLTLKTIRPVLHHLITSTCHWFPQRLPSRLPLYLPVPSDLTVWTWRLHHRWMFICVPACSSTLQARVIVWIIISPNVITPGVMVWSHGLGGFSGDYFPMCVFMLYLWHTAICHMDSPERTGQS